MRNEGAVGLSERFALGRRLTTWARRVLLGSLSVALIGAMSTLAISWPAAASQSVQLPASIPSNCGLGDTTNALSAFLAGVPANATVTFPANRCFVINQTLLLQDTTGLTIEGNGSTLLQKISPANPEPIVELWNDTNLTIENLTIDGAYTGSNGGEGDEGDYGIQFEADSGVTLTNDSMNNIQGDFLYFSPPYDVTTSDALSTGITITNSTFTYAGYHGLTVESVGCPTLAPCNGLTVSDDKFLNIGIDAMDFEYDDYSTPFNTNGTPFWAAEDDVTITHNTWINWGGDWFASIQGQLPGVQEQHLTLSDNSLEADSALFEVVGTDSVETTTASTNDYWTITGNSFVTGYYGGAYRGGNSVVGQLYSITNLKLERNSFPLCSGDYETPQPANTCTTLDQYVFDLDAISNGSIVDNDFGGALGVVQPQAYDQQLTDLTECGNTYGANDDQADQTCASPPPSVPPWFQVQHYPHGDWWTAPSPNT